MKELKGRKLILILGIPFGVGCYFIGNPLFAVVTSLIMIGGLDEFYTMSEKKGSNPNRIFGFIITILIAVSYSGIYAHHQITIMGLICLSVVCVFFIEIINQKEDFTIEGKFKIKINSIQENGYFILKKQNNLINLTLGKNYLLPEKELNFQYQDLIFLSELINPEEQGFSYEIFPQRLEIGQLISIILGKGYINRIDAWFIDYPESSQKITGFEVPAKTRFVNGDSSIEFILKKITLI